jgi:acetyl esterase
MPIHRAFSEHFHLIDGLTSFGDADHDPDARRRIDAYNAAIATARPPSVSTRSLHLPGPHGQVPVRVYEPTEVGTTRPCLIWAHGGAFRFGDLDMPEADWVSREIATRAGAVVVSVDYRLAVDGVGYPVPHDDVVAAIRWVRDHHDELGIDPATIVAGGASAGANLTAGGALRLRDDDGWLPAQLALIYPMVHTDVPPATTAFAGLMSEVPSIFRFWPHDIEFFTRNYLGGAPTRADGYAMPGTGVLTGLCPTLIVNAEYDDLRPSGEAFTAALALAGVDVRQVTLPGTLHGFLNTLSAIPPVDRALELITGVVAHPAK